MINRVLIRIKVVQMLYSYLLTRSEFKIDDAPQSASRDRRYAYSVYTDLLLLLLELSGYPVAQDKKEVPFVVNKYLEKNKVAKALAANESIRTLIIHGNSGVALFDPVIESLMHKITSSAVYADYSTKRSRDLADDVAFWTTVMETIVAKDDEIAQAMRANPAFTYQGLQQGVNALCATLRSYIDSRQLLAKAKKDLATSLDKAYELYLGLLKLIPDITRAYEEKIDNARNKYLVTSEDLNPNTRLLDNALVEYLEADENFADLLKQYKVEIVSPTSNIVRHFLDDILASQLYADYIAKPSTDFATDVDFWREVMRTIILPSDRLDEELEDKSVFWNDDLNIMGTFVLKTLRQIAASEGKSVTMLPKFKDAEDEMFGPDLFMAAVDHADEYRAYIDSFIDLRHWDPERIAFMDIVIMITAIAEIVKYPLIPVPVTINEFVEIANNYSTGKSGAFVNGILFSVVQMLNEKGIIHKNS